MVQFDYKELQFFDLRNAGRYHLSLAEASENGRFYNCMSAMIYAAFLIESYVNEVGDHLFPEWVSKKHERKPLVAKLQKILEKLNAETNLDTPLDLKQAPFQGALDEILSYRILVVHSKAQNLSVDIPASKLMRDNSWVPRSKMDIKATVENAERFLDQAEKIVKAINKQLPTGDAAHPFLKPTECPFDVGGGGTV